MSRHAAPAGSHPDVGVRGERREADAETVAAIIAVLEATLGAPAGLLQPGISRWRHAGRSYAGYDQLTGRRPRRLP